MSQWLLVLPVLLPLLTASTATFSIYSKRLTTLFSWIGALANLCVTLTLLIEVIEDGVQVTHFGGWKAPFGIVFVADYLSAVLVFVTSIIGVAIVFYSTADLQKKPSYAFYHALIHTLIAGIMGSFLTGDIFNLYVFFEVMLITSFGLMTLDASKQQIHAAVNYVILNLIATMVFLLAIGLLYGATGTLNMADLHTKVMSLPSSTMILLSGLFLFGFAIKSSMFPLFAWLPASYPSLPGAVVALFAGLLTKVGVYAMIRTFTLVFNLPDTGYQPLLIWLAGFTMLIGVLGAASQFSIKRILSFHIISQIGYMIMGLAIYTPLAIAGAILFLIHNMIVKSDLLLIGGYLERKHGTDDLKQLGGNYQSAPFIALLFLILAFSLAGFPPFSGFWGKFLLIKASLQVDYFWLAATALFVGLMTTFSMTKIWSEAFWKPRPNKATKAINLSRADTCLYVLPIASLAILSVIFGLVVEPIFQFVQTASTQLLTPDHYIQAVLSGRVQS